MLTFKNYTLKDYTICKFHFRLIKGVAKCFVLFLKKHQVLLSQEPVS